MRVGFIGLGKMGRPMATNLLKNGFHVTVHNRSRGVVDDMARLGAAPAASPAEVAAASDIVLTCLPSPEAVEMIHLGAEGLMASGRPGLILIDHSTVSLETSLKLHEAAREKGIDFLDAPISGGVPRAENGSLTIMVGGDPEAFQKAEPVLRALGDRVVQVGKPGAGTVVKLVNQLLVGVHTAVAAEALVFGVKAGADPRALLDVIGTSFGASAMFNRTASLALQGGYDSGTDVRILKKDMALITDLGRHLGARMLLSNLAEQLFGEADALGYGYNDMISLIKPLERIAGVEVK